MQYFPLFHDLADRKVVVLGGDAAAVGKLELLLRAGARPAVFAPSPGARVRALAAGGRIALSRRTPRLGDLAGAALVVAAGADGGASRVVVEAARGSGIPVNVVDRADLSTAIMPAVVDRAPVLVAVSTGGASPVLARRLRERIEAALPARLGELARFAATFRRAVAATHPNPSERRRFWEWLLDGPIADAVLAGREDEAREAMLRLVNARPPAAVSAGSAALVGIGGGDPEFMALRGLRRLQDADVVLHDAETAPALLDCLRRDARRIAIGNRRRGAVDRLMRREARAGRRVARLWPGDPSTDPRAHEAAAWLRAQGTAVEIVPGIAVPPAAPVRIAS